MGIFDSFADKPNQIREEGQEITLRFSRIDDNTGKLTWNIPPAYNGCKGQGVYNGVVLTVSKKPANYIESSPKDGNYYVGDPSVDPDLHSGSVLHENVLVVGAFYDDRQTTELEIYDLKPRTAYYFSAYAVDNVARYHREGVHSYSLPTGPEESDSDEQLPARQNIIMEDFIKLTQRTGLDPQKNYELKVDLNCKEPTVLTLRGRKSLTFRDMIDEINLQFIMSENPYQSPDMPFKNSIFSIDGVFYLWDGQNRTTLDFITSADAPNISEFETYWYNPDTGVLAQYETGGWSDRQIFSLDFDMTKPPTFTTWFDGVDAWSWKEDKWCKLNTIVTNRNPLLPPVLSTNSFWYNTDTLELTKWNKKKGRWEDVEAIYYPTDPNDISVGDFWFNETDEKVYVLRTGGEGWGLLGPIRYSERDENGELPIPRPTGGSYWYIPSEQLLLRRNLLNTEWEPETVAIYPTDPTDRNSCDIWWNSTLSVDDIFVWDKINDIWLGANSFFQQTDDPSKPSKLPEGSVWFNPETGKLLRILDDKCVEYPYIYSDFDPTNPPIGIVWKDGDVFRVWNGNMWIGINVVVSSEDPFNLPPGTYWLDFSGVLRIWDGTEWSVVFVLDTDPKPKEGFLWWNTLENKLFKWHIDSWVESKGIAFAEFIPAQCADEKDRIRIRTRKVGCDAAIRIEPRESIFAQLSTRVRYGMPVDGQDMMNSTPMWRTLGVGDDGSPDERRELHDVIRQLLGAPAVKVELTKAQLDTCIDNALKQLRKYSGQAYKRGFFFLDVWPNQQVYELKDKCTEFNKIQRVNAVYRLRSAFLRGAYSGYDIFGYAALKQLYTLGTFDILSFHMVSSFIEELEHLFATRITFQWVERTRELKLYNAVHASERVLVDANIERTEQDLLTDRETNLWLQRWALAEAKMALSQSRGKFQSLPGPNGSTVLNAQELITQSEAEKAVLMEELEDPAMSNAIEVGQKAFFILG